MNVVDRASDREARAFHAWQSEDESRRFKAAFSKVLVDAAIRGHGAIGVYAEGQIVWYSRRE